MIRDAAGSDPEARAVWDELQAERLHGMSMFARALHERGHLRPGVSAATARDVLWTYNSAEVFELLVLQRGWPPRRYGRWIADALIAALVDHALTIRQAGRMGERYTHGHHESVLRSHLWRTAENSAGHLLPHLRSGQDLLDVGCGPGTITRDLARLVAPGRVLGIDSSAEVVAQAAAEGGAEFAVGDAYAWIWRTSPSTSCTSTRSSST